MKWVWAGIFGLLALVSLVGLSVALFLVWVTGDLFLLGPAAVFTLSGTYCGLGVWAVLDEA